MTPAENIYRSDADMVDGIVDVEQFAEDFRKQETRCLEAVAWNEMRQTAGRWRQRACARRRQQKEPRLPPLAERVGTNGGSRPRVDGTGGRTWRCDYIM